MGRRLSWIDDNRLQVIIALAISLATLITYGQVIDFEFVGVDDPAYVTENPQVKAGLTIEGLLWSLHPDPESANWHPLTWLSLMLDATLFGFDAGMFHLTNALLHVLNSVLLFIALRSLTGSTWRSAFVAAVFALHPTHVESVAWVSERKDVLSTLFLMLTLVAYNGYARNPSIPRYLLVVGAFACGLLSKPMLVSVPFLLLLLDIWPLGRIVLWEKTTLSRPILIEKIPLCLMSAASCWITWVAQSLGSAIDTTQFYPFGMRAANAVTSYVSYIGMTVWPSGLSVYYPHAREINFLAVSASVVFLILATTIALKTISTRPYIIVGWLWYLVTLLPVIGLVQVGGQAMADRYTYITTIGLFIIAAWGCAEAARSRVARSALAVAAALSLLVLAATTHSQVSIWENNNTLFGHAIALRPDNWFALVNLGVVRFREGRIDDAIALYRRAVKAEPDCSIGYMNLGNALVARERFDEALEAYRQVIRIIPDHIMANGNVAGILLHKGDLRGAEHHFRAALRKWPSDHTALSGMGRIRELQGKLDEALRYYTKAANECPDSAQYWADVERLSSPASNYRK